MGSYNLSTTAQFDVIGIYKYGIKYFGIEQAVGYLTELEHFFGRTSGTPGARQKCLTNCQWIKVLQFQGPCNLLLI